MIESRPTNYLWQAATIIVLTAIYYLLPWDRFPSAMQSFGVLFVLVYSIILPGNILQALMDPRPSDPYDRVAGASLFGFAYFLLLAFVWTLSGTTLTVFVRVLPATILVLGAVATVRRGRKAMATVPGTTAHRIVAVALSAFILVVFIATLRVGVPIDFNKDTLDHVGYINEIRDTGKPFPTDAFYVDAGTNGVDFRKGLFHIFYGYTAAYLGIDTFSLLNVINAFLSVIFVLSIYSVTLIFFDNKPMAMLAAVFFVLGVNSGLGNSMLRAIFYPNRFGIALFFYFLMNVTRFIGSNGTRYLWLCALFAFAASAAHVFFAILIASTGIAVAAWKICFPQLNMQEHLGRMAKLAVAVTLGVLPYGLYRYFTAYPGSNELHTEIQGVMYITNSLFVAEPIKVLSWFGLIGVLSYLMVIPLWRQRKSSAPIGVLMAAALTLPLVLFNPFVYPLLHSAITYLTYRLLILYPFFILVSYFVVHYVSSPRSSRGWFSSTLIILLAAATTGALIPLAGDHSFSRQASARSNDISHLTWANELQFLATELPHGSVIVSDPVTSYTIPALTPHFVVCTLDQHAPPNDLLLESRIQATRDILNPYVSMDRTTELLVANRATHIVHNKRFSGRFTPYYWSMDERIYLSSLRKFESHPELFQKLYEQDGFAVFEWTGELAAKDTTAVNPYVLQNVPGDFTRIGEPAGEAILEGFRIETGETSRGGIVEVEFVWSGSGDYTLRNYVVVLRFDNTETIELFSKDPLPKISRKIKERMINQRYRFRAEHKVLNGFMSPDAWRPGELIIDRATISVPLDLVPGEYAISVKLLTVFNQPVYHLADYFYDEDKFQGRKIGTIRIQ